MAKKLTDKQIKALIILRDHGPMRPEEFARRMWPDALGWKKHGKCGPYGATTGVGMRLGAGGYLGRLRKAGLAEYRWSADRYGTYTGISPDGLDALRERTAEH